MRGGIEQAEVPAPLPYPGCFVLSDWRPALTLAALDCAEETNSAVCRDFNIQGFPTVRVCDRRGRGQLLPASLVCPGLPSSAGFSDAPGLHPFKSQPWNAAPMLDETPVLEAERGVTWEAEKKEVSSVWQMLPSIRGGGCVWVYWTGRFQLKRSSRGLLRAPGGLFPVPLPPDRLP